MRVCLSLFEMLSTYQINLQDFLLAVGNLLQLHAVWRIPALVVKPKEILHFLNLVFNSREIPVLVCATPTTLLSAAFCCTVHDSGAF